MRLSRIWKFLQIKEGVIHLGLQPVWITPSLIRRILCILQKPNSKIIALLFTQNISLFLKGVLPFQFLFFRSPKVTQSRPQVFSVNGSIICCRLHFWRHFDVISLIICSWLHFWHHWFNMTKILFKLNGQQQLARVNYMYVCGFNQLEMGKYFWMNNN